MNKSDNREANPHSPIGTSHPFLVGKGNPISHDRGSSLLLTASIMPLSHPLRMGEVFGVSPSPVLSSLKGDT